METEEAPGMVLHPSSSLDGVIEAKAEVVPTPPEVSLALSPLAEALQKVEALPNASSKPVEQRRLVAYLLANREFLRYLASLVLDNLPPVLQNLLSKIFPVKPEDLWKVPIEAVWRAEGQNWQTFADFLAGAYEYGFDKSKPNP